MLSKKHREGAIVRTFHHSSTHFLSPFLVFFFFFNCLFPSLFSSVIGVYSYRCMHSQRNFWLLHTCKMATRNLFSLSAHLAPTTPWQGFAFRTPSIEFQVSIRPAGLSVPAQRRFALLTLPTKLHVAPSGVRPSQEVVAFLKKETLSLEVDRGHVQLSSAGRR